MELIDGECKVTLAGQTDTRTYRSGESFNVPGNSTFEIEVLTALHYVCHFG